MARLSRILGVAVAGTCALLTLATCGKNAADSGNQSISDPAVFESTARQGFLPMVAGISDGVGRLLTALGGGLADGVVIIPNSNGADATISVDFDGNGSREGTIGGSLVGDIASGAQVTVAAIAT